MINVQKVLKICEDEHINQKYENQINSQTKKTLYDNIIEAFNNKIRGSESMIIGVDFVGMILGAKLASISQKPFSYMISNKNAVYYGKYDKQVIIGDNNIIIVTDVIVTGETVNNIINQLKNNYGIDKDRIEKILTIFRRREIKISSNKRLKIPNYLDCLEDKIVSLNNSIDIELCLKESCVFKENKICLCENKRR